MKLSKHEQQELKRIVLCWKGKMDQGMICQVVGLKSGEVIEFEGRTLWHNYRTIRKFINQEMERGGSQWDLACYHEEDRHSDMCKHRAGFEVKLGPSQVVPSSDAEQDQLEEAASVIIAELMEGDPHQDETQQRCMVEILLDMHNSGMITINPPELEETKLLSASELLKAVDTITGVK